MDYNLTNDFMWWTFWTVDGLQFLHMTVLEFVYCFDMFIKAVAA